MALTSGAASDVGISSEDFVEGSASQILEKYWISGGRILVVGAIGAVTRLIAPLLVGKEKDPAVIVLDAMGSNVVPILGGHRAGADDFALFLAEELGGSAVITSDSNSQGILPLDCFGEAWGWERSGNVVSWKKLMLCQAKGENLKVNQESGSALWLSTKGAQKSLKTKEFNNSLLENIMTIGPKVSNECCWHPLTLWVGIGCELGTSPSLVDRAFTNALKEVGLALEAVAGLASIDLKENEQALHVLAKKRGLPIRFFNAEQLALVSVPNPSEDVKDAVGTASVSEASALLAAGEDGSLVKPKKIFRSKDFEEGAATIAIANAKVPFAPTRGELHLVGSGPGELTYLTHDARCALSRSVIWIGYQRYLDFLEPIRRHDQVRVDGQLTFELDRCKQALDLAQQGARVALVSSGDSGIYGMAGLALELWLGLSEIDRPAFTVHPGISAIQLAASRVGAPLMNDFCTISLSDRLTPWSVIKTRLLGALVGDFVIAIYNPRSKDRDWQLQQAINLIREHRSDKTTLVIARQLGRLDEKIDFYTVDNFPIENVDMLTLILIGNSKSFTKENYFLTPRGYKN